MLALQQDHDSSGLRIERARHVANGMPHDFLNAIVGNGGFIRELVVCAASLGGFEEGGGVGAGHGDRYGKFRGRRKGGGYGDCRELKLEGFRKVNAVGNGLGNVSV